MPLMMTITVIAVHFLIFMKIMLLSFTKSNYQTEEGETCL